MTEFGVIKEDDRWWLEDALAWVMTKNICAVTDADVDDYAPSLRFHEDGTCTTNGRREDEGWRLLYKAMTEGTVRTYAQNLNDPAAWGEVQPKMLQNMRWHATEGYVTLRRNDPNKLSSEIMRPLKLSAKDLVREFPESDGPIDLTSEDYEKYMIRPTGDGQMTFSDAGLWVATEGGTKRIIVSKPSSWRDAFSALVAKITSGNIVATGRLDGKAPQVVIDGVTFGGLQVRYPHVFEKDPQLLSFVMGEIAHISCCGPQVPDAEWQAGTNDKIIVHKHTRERPLYTHILLDKARVAQAFPFGLTGDVAKIDPVIETIAETKTGDMVRWPKEPESRAKAQAQAYKILREYFSGKEYELTIPKPGYSRLATTLNKYWKTKRPTEFAAYGPITRDVLEYLFGAKKPRA